MRESFLKLLECPVCHSHLRFDSVSRQGDRIRSGALVCSTNHTYPIREFIPAFAQEKDYMEVFSNLRKNPKTFLHPTPELDVRKITREEFVGQTGLQPEELRGKTVLDAGCGGGRFVELLLSHGARVVGMDIDSTGLKYMDSKFADHGDAHLAQADLFHLPFRSGSFDFVYSLGVLHHTPDPKAAFLNLTRLLKPSGQIAVWVYPKSERTPFSDFFRPVTTQIPGKYLYWIAWAVTGPYGPLLNSPRFKDRLTSILYNARLPWHNERHWRIHSFMDWYGPRYQFKYHPEELESWFTEAGLVDLVRGTYATSARGTAAPRTR